VVVEAHHPVHPEGQPTQGKVHQGAGEHVARDPAILGDHVRLLPGPEGVPLEPAAVRRRHQRGNGEAVEEVALPAAEDAGGLEALIPYGEQHLEGRLQGQFVGQGADELQVEQALPEVDVLHPGRVGEGMGSLHPDGEFQFPLEQVLHGLADAGRVLHGCSAPRPPAWLLLVHRPAFHMASAGGRKH